ncbi:MAG TPA: hypothetical protein PLQ49_03930 [Methanothrix sp.]|nr:hypothetical protein [Methanothrix sp.]HRW83253.1 hypothetical protein [Methanothrix sp.]
MEEDAKQDATRRREGEVQMAKRQNERSRRQRATGERQKPRFKAKDKSPEGYLPGVGVLIHDQYRNSKR